MFISHKFTTCSSSAPELSSGIVSGKTVSFGDDSQVLCCYYFLKITFYIIQNFDNAYLVRCKLTSSSITFEDGGALCSEVD